MMIAFLVRFVVFNAINVVLHLGADPALFDSQNLPHHLANGISRPLQWGLSQVFQAYSIYKSTLPPPQLMVYCL